jgi:hypothetical protein
MCVRLRLRSTSPKDGVTASDFLSAPSRPFGFHIRLAERTKSSS